VGVGESYEDVKVNNEKDGAAGTSLGKAAFKDERFV
jgi:hypothetical protein